VSDQGLVFVIAAPLQLGAAKIPVTRRRSSRHSNPLRRHLLGKDPRDRCRKRLIRRHEQATQDFNQRPQRGPWQPRLRLRVGGNLHFQTRTGIAAAGGDVGADLDLCAIKRLVLTDERVSDHLGGIGHAYRRIDQPEASQTLDQAGWIRKQGLRHTHGSNLDPAV
jgi:hypothetical protein